MFTGIVTDMGRVRAVEPAGDVRFTIETAYDLATVEIGASISCDGCCLTAVDKGDGWFAVTASAETLGCTTLGGWRAGSRVNLERSLRVGDELGGHIVSGHVDGVATVASRRAEGDSIRFAFDLPAPLAPYVAAKGSIALNGVSLTVNEIEGARFGVNVIPHTQKVTTFGALREGDGVNVEIDLLARYVARLVGKGAA